MPGLSPGFVGGIGTDTAVAPFKYYSPGAVNTSIPVPLLGWDNDGDYQVPNDYNNALYMINVAECSLGDNPELPPPSTFSARDIILMGWQGYYATRARMLEYDANSPFPIIVTTVPVMDWSDELHLQKDKEYNSPALGMLQLAEYSLGDNPESINYSAGVLTGWDADAVQQLSNVVDSSRMQDPTDNTIRIFIPTTEIDNDSEQQFSNELNSSSKQDPDDRITLIFIPRVGIDNDSDNQIPSPVWTSNIASDSGQDTTQFIILPIIADQYELNQFSIDLITAYAHSDIGQEWTQLIVAPAFNPAFVPQVEEQQINTQYQVSSILEDDRSNLIILPFNNWDNDGESQKAQPDYFKDHLADEEVEFITLPFNDWTVDVENQKLQFGNYTDHLSDEAVEKITLNPAVTSLFFFDTDVENQIPSQVGFSSDTLTDEGVEQITLAPAITRMFGFDSDAEQQLSNSSNYSNFQDPEDRQLLILAPPVPTMSSHDIDQYGMLLNRASQFTSDDQGNSETTNYIILVPFIDVVEIIEEGENE